MVDIYDEFRRFRSWETKGETKFNLLYILQRPNSNGKCDIGGGKFSKTKVCSKLIGLRMVGSLLHSHPNTSKEREREKEESKWDAHMWMPLRTFDTAQTKQFNERSIRICVKWWVAVITIIGISSSRISSTVFSNLWNSFVA